MRPSPFLESAIEPPRLATDVADAMTIRWLLGQSLSRPAAVLSHAVPRLPPVWPVRVAPGTGRRRLKRPACPQPWSASAPPLTPMPVLLATGRSAADAYPHRRPPCLVRPSARRGRAGGRRL
jgi:hypothetical protein